MRKDVKYSEKEKITRLKNAVQDGIDSGLVYDFDLEENLKILKEERKSRI